MVHTERDHNYSATLSRWPLKSHSGHLSHEKEARQWEPKAAAEFASAADSGTLLFWRSGVSTGEKENDITLEKKMRKQKGLLSPAGGPFCLSDPLYFVSLSPAILNVCLMY